MNKRIIQSYSFFFIIVCLISCGIATTNSQSDPDYYTEKHRPQFHFSPEANWMNDPNGMVYFEGEYHLFYQYYPDSTVWGPMHWGHAVTTDLVHWEHLPIALYPDENGYIFSGSAVVDWNNTSGFGKENQPPLIAIFSFHHMEKARAGDDDFQTQGIAYSNDNGRTWTKYEGNPVIKNPGVKDFRDPKVIWHEETKSWVMAVAAKDHLKFYRSPNLREWNLLSEFGKDKGSHEGVWECPDLFPITADNGQKYWVLIENMNPGNPNGGSGTQYFIGQFDGKSFTVDPNFNQLLEVVPESTDHTGSVWLDAGRDNYAGVTWSDVPKSDGRRIFIGWMTNWSYAQVVPTDKWRSAMTIPWQLEVKHVDKIPRLVGTPVDELKQLRAEALPIKSNQFDLGNGLAEIELKISSRDNFELQLKNGLTENVRFVYDRQSNEFRFYRTESTGPTFSAEFAGVHSVKRISSDDQIKLKAFIDHSSIELFLDDGLNIFTETFFPTVPFNNASLKGEFSDVMCYPLKQIWR